MATIVQKTIGTATNRDYSTVDAWIAACPSDLVAVDQVWKGVLYNDSIFANTLANFGTHNTDATRYIWLTVDSGSRHSGRAYTTTGVRLTHSDPTGYAIDTSNSNYTLIEWVQIAPLNGGSGITAVGGTNNLTVRNCIIYYGVAQANSNPPYVAAIYVQGSLVYNNLVYGNFYRGIYEISTTNIYNNTFYSTNASTVKCIGFGTGTQICVNNIAMAAGGACFNGSATTFTNNMSNDPVGNLPNKIPANQFISLTAGSEDFRLKAGADAIGAGASQTSIFTTDIRGLTRQTTWDIGATSSIFVASLSLGTRTAYGTGLVSTDSTGLIVTLTGGTFDTNWGEGDSIFISTGGSFNLAFSSSFSGGNRVLYYVDSRIDSTHLLLQSAAPASQSGLTYSIQRAYSMIATWFAACPADLVATNQIWKGVMYKDSDFTDMGLNFVGVTTDAAHYLWITPGVGQMHTGTAGTGVRWKNVGSFSSSRINISINVNYTIMEGIDWDLSGSTGVGSIQWLLINVNINTHHTTLRNHIMHDYAGYQGIGIYTYADGVSVYNNLIYNMGGAGAYGIFNAGPYYNNYPNYIYNNTVYNCRVGIQWYGYTAANMIIYNNISMNNNIADFNPTGGGAYTLDYNISSDTSAVGANSFISKVATNEFVSPSTGDFHLKLSGTDAILKGINLSSVFSNDIKNVNRSLLSAWDIGAFRSTLTLSRTIGTSSRDYSTIQAWMSACPASLSAVTAIWKGVAYKDSTFTGSCSSYGIMTDSVSFMLLTTGVGQRHTGKPGTGVVLDCQNALIGIQYGYYASTYGNNFYCVIDGLEIKNCSGVGDQRGAAYVGAWYCTVSNCLIYNDTTQQGTALYLIGGGSGNYITCFNNVIWNMSRGIQTGNTGRNLVYNNTITNCLFGLKSSFNDYSYFYNNIIIGNTTNYSYDAGAYGRIYNCAKEAADTLPGATSGIVNASVANTFNNSAANDYRLKIGSPCIGAALDGSSVLTTDVLGKTRILPWDIGAYIYYTLIKARPPMFMFNGRGALE